MNTENILHYQKTNIFFRAREDMSLSEFKLIFYMEWFHRMYGRMVGLTFYLPAAYFWTKGYLTKAMKIRSIIFGSLILGQVMLFFKKRYTFLFQKVKICFSLKFLRD